MNMNFNYTELRDKIHGCWIGKNIGGTMGGPFEGKRELLDIPGFTTPKGEPLPNDDLDLQLVWLRYLEENGPFNMTALDLGEYWISYIVPHWAEYGIGKSTVFRLINQLADEGSVRLFREENGKASLCSCVEEKERCDEHFHLKCSKCGMLFHTIDVNNLRYILTLIFHILLYFRNFSLNLINIVLFHNYHEYAGLCSFCFHIGRQLSSISVDKILVGRAFDFNDSICL